MEAKHASEPRLEGRPAPRGVSGALFAGVAASALLALASTGAAAQGFGIYEHGTCTMGRGGAAVAAPCDDGSAMFFNPAGLAGSEGWTLSAGGTLIAAFGEFTSDATREEFDLQNDPIPVPNGYAALGVTDRLAVGLGVFVPYGLETKWPSTRESGFEGRFVGYDNALRSIYVQPTVSYRPTEWLSVGAGLDVVVSTVELNQHLDLSRQPIAPGVRFGELGIPANTDFADANLESDPSTGIGGHVGVQVHATEDVTLGARYLTQVTIDYEGEASFDQIPTGLTVPTDLTLPGGTVVPAGTPVDALVAPLFGPDGALSDQAVATEITMPDQLVAGVAVRPTDRLLLEADWQWVNWEDFDRIVIDLERAPDSERVQDYGDTHGVRVGGEYDLGGRVDVRAGYLYHGAAAPDETVTPLLPEATRNELTAGLGLRLAPSISLDVAYQFIAQNDRRGRVEEPLDGREPTSALNSGLYSFGAHLFGTTFTFHF